jgi:nicotinamide riboside transporter PnuC
MNFEEEKFNPIKTAVKTIEAPSVIIIGSKVLPIILNQFGIEMSNEVAYLIVTSIYGTFSGFRNWIKNRKK